MLQPPGLVTDTAATIMHQCLLGKGNYLQLYFCGLIVEQTILLNLWMDGGPVKLLHPGVKRQNQLCPWVKNLCPWVKNAIVIVSSGFNSLL